MKSAQREIAAGNLLPLRAAELLTQLTALLGNCSEEIRQADHDYSIYLLACLETDKHANRARIRSETHETYQRKREARDTKELVVELVRSLKYLLRTIEEEMRLTPH